MATVDRTVVSCRADASRLLEQHKITIYKAVRVHERWRIVASLKVRKGRKKKKYSYLYPKGTSEAHAGADEESFIEFACEALEDLAGVNAIPLRPRKRQKVNANLVSTVAEVFEPAEEKKSLSDDLVRIEDAWAAQHIDDDVVRELFLERASSEAKDGMKYWEIKKWAKKTVAARALRNENVAQWRVYSEIISTALKLSSTYLIIDDDAGNPMKLSALSRKEVRWYQLQLTALNVVYNQLLLDNGPGKLYVTLTQAVAAAADASGKTPATVRRWMRAFEFHGGKLRLWEYGSYVRSWLFDDKVKRDLVRRWVEERVQRKNQLKNGEPDTIGVFKARHFMNYINHDFLSACRAVKVDAGAAFEEGKPFKIGLTTATHWLKKYVSLHYYVILLHVFILIYFTGWVCVMLCGRSRTTAIDTTTMISSSIVTILISLRSWLLSCGSICGCRYLLMSWNR